MSTVTVRHMSKTFHIRPARPATLRAAYFEALRPHSTPLPALVDLSLKVESGEWLGIVGPNGSGKTTLLKLIAGIYTPDSGSATTTGPMATFLDLGVGFHPELNARDNIFLDGLIAGLKPAEIARAYPEIIAFAEVEPFTDMPLKQFSSGMRQRLAFAITLAIKAPILLYDEIAAVGDAAFQSRCQAALAARRRAGTTALVVSHNPSHILALCDRAIYLAEGRLQMAGSPTEVLTAYGT